MSREPASSARGSEGQSAYEALVRFIADCLLTGTKPIIGDEQEAEGIAEAIVDLGIERGLFGVPSGHSGTAAGVTARGTSARTPESVIDTCLQESLDTDYRVNADGEDIVKALADAGYQVVPND